MAPIQVAIAQLRDLRPLFGRRRVIVVADRGYCSAEFLRACHELGYSVLVRLKSDRKLYRPGVRLHKRGPCPKDGPLFQGKRQETHGPPEHVCHEHPRDAQRGANKQAKNTCPRRKWEKKPGDKEISINGKARFSSISSGKGKR